MKRVPIALGLALALVTPAGHADPIVFAPPFSGSESSHTCSGLALSSCSSSADADESSARIALEAAMESSEAGSLPGRGDALTEGTLTTTFTLHEEVPTLDVDVTVNIHHAETVVDTMTMAAGSPVTSQATIFLFAATYSHACFCTGGRTQTVLTNDPNEIDDTEVTMTFRLGNIDDPEVPIAPGTIEVRVTLIGFARLGALSLPGAVPVPDVGRVSFEVDATVTSVVARVAEDT